MKNLERMAGSKSKVKVNVSTNNDPEQVSGSLHIAPMKDQHCINDFQPSKDTSLKKGSATPNLTSPNTYRKNSDFIIN